MAEVNPLFEMLNMIEGDKIPWNELPENLKAAYNPFIINRLESELYADGPCAGLWVNTIVNTKRSAA